MLFSKKITHSKMAPSIKINNLTSLNIRIRLRDLTKKVWTFNDQIIPSFNNKKI